jgi:hypothetical protein
VRPPNVATSSWRCAVHGDVVPYYIAGSSRERALDELRERSRVPVWAPDPLPVGWFPSGVAWAGDDRAGPRAAAVAVAGPSPLGGPADMVLIADEPGVGVGARLAGLGGADPADPDGLNRPPQARVEAYDHPTALWSIGPATDRAAFVGEAGGVWLWVVLWPANAAILLLENLVLRDLRDAATAGIVYTFGASSPRLAGTTA